MRKNNIYRACKFTLNKSQARKNISRSVNHAAQSTARHTATHILRVIHNQKRRENRWSYGEY